MQRENKQVSVLFMLYSMLFCVCLITANVMETKQIDLGLITITGGLLVFPVSYIINDCVSEVWGFRKARFLIWLGFAMNFIFVMFTALCDALPGASYWTNDEGFHAIFGLAPRLVASSFIAFVSGSLINAYVMSRMKVISDGRFFFARAILSTIFGETVDTLIFFPLAFVGVIPFNEMIVLMVTQIVMKTLYEVIALPITIRVVRLTKRHEGIDVYDNGVDYNMFRVKNL